MDRKSVHPVVRVAKAKPDEGGVVTLSSGYKARVRAVSAKLIDEVASTVPEPKVPKQFIEAKGREEYNPLDPEYVREAREANRKRGVRITEALIMFGIELVDPVPPNETWLPGLRYLEKRGSIVLDAFDFNDPMDCEFVFKCYIAVTPSDMRFVSMASGLTEREVSVAVAGFPGKAPRDTDPASGAEA